MIVGVSDRQDSVAVTHAPSVGLTSEPAVNINLNIPSVSEQRGLKGKGDQEKGNDLKRVRSSFLWLKHLGDIDQKAYTTVIY